ncbi:MAG: aminotransferase class III-fold pyridoxal phosphate-dependent enzyme [Acidobacteria bacterium]|nr:aminotransferase class III-fold pyridoxal phosphate-dependent enzyme [Acidobacteriota bacterium]
MGPLGAYPLYLDRAAGPYAWDVDQQRYVDWFNGNCAVTLGHGHPLVRQCIVDALQTFGALPSLPTRLEAEVAENLCRVIPCAESIRFVKTGSEACAGAVRIARMATGRDVIVCAEGQYHGWHDWHCVTKPYHPGVPDILGSLVRTFRWGDADSLLAAMGQDVAAVMVEPALPSMADPVWLQTLANIAHAHGALVAFDEMITGGRLHLGGAQVETGVIPDLGTFGKAYANGHALAFIAGSRELMRHAWPVSGTFGAETVGLAACLAVLKIHAQEQPLTRLHRVGQWLIDGFNGIASRLGFVARMAGHACRPHIDWQEPDTGRLLMIRSLFQQELAARGVLTHWGAWNPSAAHEAQQVGETLTAIDGALTSMAGYLADPDPSTHLRGELIQPAFTRPAA